MKFNIYAGLEGSFGGATYQGTGEFKNLDEASDVACKIAYEIYESYAGSDGVLDWCDVAESNNLDPDDEDNAQDINDFYIDEVESRIEYYVVLTEYDDLTEEEMFEL